MDLQFLFSEAVRLNASDLHLIVNFPPMLRLVGKLTPVAGAAKLGPTEIEQLVLTILNPEQKNLFTTNREIDFAISAAGNRFRANVYYQKNTIAAEFRLIPIKIRSVSELGLPDICNQFTKLHQGFILVTGPTGHGKSTTLAAMINEINLTRAIHVVTIEDPVEYIYPPGLAIVSQREMHGDTYSWNVALRSVLRQDPDVVLIGEMRDFETIQSALTVAETGHLVFATLHTNSAAQSIDRIVDVFPENQQNQVRLQLGSTLEGIISQRLVPDLAGGRFAVAEILTGTPAVRNTIREGKTHLLDNIIQTSAEFGMATLEMSLAAAVTSGKISVEKATAYALRPADLGKLMRR